MLAESLHYFEAVLETLEMYLDVTAHALWIAKGGTLHVHHDVLGGNHMLPTMALNSDRVWLPQCLVVSLVSCSMGHGVRTGECLEMVAAKLDNYTLVEDEFDLLVALIECLCLVFFQHYYLMLLHCHLDVVVSYTAHQLEPYWLSWAEAHSSILYVNKKTVLNKLSIELVILNAAMIFENIEYSSDLRQNEGLL